MSWSLWHREDEDSPGVWVCSLFQADRICCLRLLPLILWGKSFQSEQILWPTGVSNVRAVDHYWAMDGTSPGLLGTVPQQEVNLNVVCLNHPKTIPSTQSVEKLPFQKLVLAAKKVGDCCSRTWKLKEGKALRGRMCFFLSFEVQSVQSRHKAEEVWNCT